MDFSGYHFPQFRHAGFSDIQPSVHWAQLHKTYKNNEYPLRRIYDFELLYVLDGRITAFIGDQVLSLSSGELLFISAGVPHCLNVESTLEAILLGIHFDFFDELEILVDQDIIVNNETFNSNEVCKEPLITGFKPLSETPVLIPPAQTIVLMETLIEEFQGRQLGFEIVCRGLMQQILVRLYRSALEKERILHPLYGERMVRLAEWMESHYREDCSSSRLTSITNLNEDYLAKQFKSAFGLPPGKYIQMIRHREAKRLLSQTDLSVEAIGREVGYDDIHYFSRIFRKWEGISPREYRNLTRIY